MRTPFDTVYNLATEDQRAHMRFAPFAAEERLAEAGSPVRSAIFLLSGVASAVITIDGQSIDVGIAGAEVVIGPSERPLHFATWITRHSGHSCAMPVEDLIAIQSQHTIVRDIIQSGDRFMQAQAQQLAACNSQHKARARLASYLLRARDYFASNELYFRQETLASALGVQRASISSLASALGDEGTIGYTRGRIQILDVGGLEGRACECHRSIRRQYEAIFDRSMPIDAAATATQD